jgi:hypothetical protein
MVSPMVAQRHQRRRDGMSSRPNTSTNVPATGGCVFSRGPAVQSIRRAGTPRGGDAGGLRRRVHLFTERHQLSDFARRIAVLQDRI